MYQKILVPVDGSEHSHYTLSQAVQLAGFFGANTKVTVFHVCSYVPYSDMSMAIDMSRLLQDEGKAVLAAAEPFFTGVGFVHDAVALEGDPAAEICRKAEQEGYDLIVIGNRGRGLFSELLLGSVSHKVIQHAPCPVLVIRKPA